MAREKKFDINNLTQKEEESKFIRTIKQAFSFIMTVFFMTIILYIIAASFIKTPQQRLLEYETATLKKEYERQYKQYKQLEKMVEDLEQKDRDIYQVIFESEAPIEKPLTNFDTLEKLKVKKIIRWNRRDLQTELSKWPPLEKEYKNLVAFVNKHNDSLRSVPGIQPVPNNMLQFVVYGYGRKIDPVYKTPSFHHGIDFAAPGGTPVFATADGRVIEANQKIRGLGLHVKINHGNGFVTLYAHLSDLAVRSGQKVKMGDVIGYVGNTGKALLPHLHYEITYKGHSLNPIYFFFAELSPEKYYKLKLSAERSGISLD